MLARAHCLRARAPFTTSYHTQFPEYIAARAPVPRVVDLRPAAPLPQRRPAVMVATPALAQPTCAAAASAT